MYFGSATVGVDVPQFESFYTVPFFHHLFGSFNPTGFSINLHIHSRLSRSSTARGFDSRLSLGGPTKVKARKSFLFTEVSLKVEIKSTCFILLSHFIVQAVTKIVTGCLGAMKSCHICIR